MSPVAPLPPLFGPFQPLHIPSTTTPSSMEVHVATVPILRTSAGWLLAVFLFSGEAFGTDGGLPPLARVRPVTGRLERAVARGRLESPTFRTLVEAIEASRAFVYIVEVPNLPEHMNGCVP